MPLACGVYFREVAICHVCSERGTGSSVDKYFVKNTILVLDIGKMNYVFFMLITFTMSVQHFYTVFMVKLIRYLCKE